MVLDTSAIVTVLLAEAGHERVVARFNQADIVLVGAPTVFETAMVLTTRLGVSARATLTGFLVTQEVQIVSFSEEHYRAATDAFLRYGKGRHPAGLNFGDCMSYATAAVADLPLLFIGNDFSKTDIRAALL